MPELVTSVQLAKLFDECIGELEKKSAEKLMGLGSCLSAIGETSGNLVFIVAKRLLASYANEVMRFYPFVAVPVLGKDIRPKYIGLFEKAIKVGVSSLKGLKKELCEAENPDHCTILNALGNIEKLGFKLYEGRQNIQRLRLLLSLPSSQEGE